MQTSMTSRPHPPRRWNWPQSRGLMSAVRAAGRGWAMGGVRELIRRSVHLPDAGAEVSLLQVDRLGRERRDGQAAGDQLGEEPGGGVAAGVVVDDELLGLAVDFDPADAGHGEDRLA